MTMGPKSEPRRVAGSLGMWPAPSQIPPRHQLQPTASPWQSHCSYCPASELAQSREGHARWARASATAQSSQPGEGRGVARTEPTRGTLHVLRAGPSGANSALSGARLADLSHALGLQILPPLPVSGKGPGQRAGPSVPSVCQRGLETRPEVSFPWSRL